MNRCSPDQGSEKYLLMGQQAAGITRNCGHDFMGKMVLQLRFLLILNNTPATYTKGIGQTWASETGHQTLGSKIGSFNADKWPTNLRLRERKHTNITPTFTAKHQTCNHQFIHQPDYLKSTFPNNPAPSKHGH